MEYADGCVITMLTLLEEELTGLTPTRYDAQHLLAGPDVVVQGVRGLHLCYRVRR
ncbi:hypothetical protein GCM10029964_065790 [Kibdelosporangium lantanae]